MERPIGETFTHDGVELRVEGEIDNCEKCYFCPQRVTFCAPHRAIIGHCGDGVRSDEQGVIFTEVK
jgi:hypothetical protein